MDTIDFNNQVIKETILYILEKEGKVRLYSLMKTLYLAERDHLAQWGGRITDDVYSPLRYGPVPVKIHNALKSDQETFLSDVLVIKKPFVSALREPNMEYLSKSAVYALDRAIQFVRTHSFEEIKNATHDQFYNEARIAKRELTDQEIALSGGATPEMLSYINEQLFIDRALV